MIVPGGISSIVEKGILFASLIMFTLPGEVVLFTVRLRQRTSTGGSDTIDTLVLLASPEPDRPDCEKRTNASSMVHTELFYVGCKKDN